MKGDVRNGQVQVQQMYKYLPQSANYQAFCKRSKARMDSI